MKFYLLLSKRNLLVFFALCVIGFLIYGSIASLKMSALDGSTNAKRINFISRLGYDVDDSATFSKEIKIPMDFGDVYTEYNKLQEKAGFDLYDYRGKTAKVFTYDILYKEDMELHLIVYDGIIIGGDVASVRLGGEMKALAPIKK